MASILLLCHRTGSAFRTYQPAAALRMRCKCHLSGSSNDASSSSWASLGPLLRPELVEAVNRLGYDQMSDIQAKALPFALRGRDVLGRAKTGSGKTAVFGLSALQSLDMSDSESIRKARSSGVSGAPQVLVLSPTRELAAQLAASVRRLGAPLGEQQGGGLRVVSCVGGAKSRDQKAALASPSGVHIVVGTPGRLRAHIASGAIDTSQVRTLVLDEADTLLDMGFEDEVNAIVKAVPRRQRQTLLFSATWSERVRSLGRRACSDPAVVSIGEGGGDILKKVR